MAAARRASTPATLVRYSIVPRLSVIGLQAACAAESSRANVSSLSLWPINDKRGTIEYRVKVAGVLARRAAAIAFERAAKR